MANLNKLLVHVPSNLCDGFKTKYVYGIDRSYDNKVVFLEKTQEIFTQGKIYGTSIQDFNALKTLVGEIPASATSKNIVNYINEKIDSADHIHSVSQKYGETLIGVTTSDKAVTINSTSALTKAVSNANSALQSVTVLGKILDKTNNSLTVKEATTYLGLKSAAFQDSTAFDAAGAAAGVVAKLPVVTNGSGITVTPSTDGNGKTTYTVSTSAEVFHYKGNKLTLAELPASGNTTGDVWSVGPADAQGSTLYAWDGDEWINIGGANGITGVDTTDSHGVSLAKNSNGTVKVNVNPGLIADGDGSVVTGGAVNAAILTRCDAKGTAQGLINALGGSKDSANGDYVNVTVATSKGQVSEVIVHETERFINAIDNANAAMQSVTVLGKNLNKNTNSVTVAEAKKFLELGSAAYKDYTAFDTAGTAQKLINKLGGTAKSTNGDYVNVEVNTSKGQASAVKVTETDALKTAVYNANNAVQTITGDSPYLSATKNGTSVTLNLDETEVFNYVANNIWETYSA